MSYDDNPIDFPERYGFDSFVTQGDLAEPYYSFSIFGVLKKGDDYYLSTDSGCSCPSPWESHTADDFTGPLTAEQVHEEVRSLWEASYDRVPETEVVAALEAVV